ncbi:MAG TPA: helix-turn-helix transcriptional regulator [Clostridia bacterium]|nr:helix-turn-helix transcriptional regulator [Clostridia bacterium]
MHAETQPGRAGRVAQHPDSLTLVTDLRGVPGSILKAARTALGWTIQRAAGKTGISSVTLSKIEAGKSRANVGPADEPILSAYLRAGVTIHRGDDAFWVSVHKR